MKYVKRQTVVIDAVQWTGDNIEEVKEFVGDSFVIEGDMRVNLYDYIVKEGVLGEFYTCSPNIFEATYDEVEDK